MSKYDFEFKKKVINSYLNGEGGFRVLANRYGLGCACVRNWVHAYERYGDA